MNQMTRQQAMLGMLQGVAEDQQAYRSLLDLLEQQFQAALRHQQARLGEIAGEISTLVDSMEARRRLRVELAERLVGTQGGMAQVFALLKHEPRARLEADWAELEQMVLEAKARGKRNGDLLAEQYTIMEKVLKGEDQTYEPV